MTTSNCTFCKYGGSWTGKGKGHCYMFKEEPQGVCEKHTGNKVQPDKSEPVAIRHSWDGNGWLYTDSGSGSGWRDSIDQPGAEFVYAAPQAQPDEGDGDDLTIAYMAGAASNKAKPVADYVPLSDGQIYTAYIEASNQTLRPQDERIAIAFARAVERAVRGKK